MPDDKNESFAILIVDDERVNILALNEILSQEYTIYIAKSAALGMKIIKESKPDLILLDVLMPEMNGFEMLNRLQASDDYRDIPVIFITGLDDPKDEEKGFILGAVDYIKKPFVSAIVKARVNTQIKIIKQMRVNNFLGMTDALTGLSNRRKFDEVSFRAWRAAIRENKSICFLMLDLDKFKTFNDTYGHPQGDTMLKAVSRVIAKSARRATDLAARLGGEEFGVLLPGALLSDALSIAEGIRSKVDALRIRSANDSEITRMTVSIGAAYALPQTGDSLKEFLRKADLNLYQAKSEGRNRVCG